MKQRAGIRFDIGKRILQILEDQGKSQLEISGDKRLSQSTISRWINGICLPTLGLLDLFCRYMHMTLTEFFDVEEYKDPVIRELIQIIRHLPAEKRLDLLKALRALL